MTTLLTRLSSAVVVLLLPFTMSTTLAATIEPPDSASHPLRIWQTSPGVYYNDSFLIGNGRMGAAVLGTPQEEAVPMNEDSFWSGGRMDRVNPDASVYMEEIQELLREGKVLEANKLAGLALVGTPESMRHYDFMGDLQIRMEHGADVEAYERWLDVEEGVAGIYYEVDGVAYQREYLASNPDDIIAVRIKASKAGAVSFRVHLRRGTSLNRYQDYGEKVGPDTIVMGSASGGVDAIAFAAGARVVAKGGKTRTIGDRIVVDAADEATVWFSAWTTYRKDEPREAVLQDLERASVLVFEDVRRAHVEDHQNLLGRVELDLGKSTQEQKQMTTADRMEGLAKREDKAEFDPELAVLYYQFGRYLLIATSREGTLPPNLQGLWNNEADPFWGSKYTININLEMNYWPALVTNLAELNQPLFDLIKRVHESGWDTAKRMYNASTSGSVAHHNTDVWADTAPQDNYFASTFWPSGLAWLVTHGWEHYLFTGDKEVLAEMWPVMRDAAQFYLDFMSDYKGYKVTNPSSSPEHAYLVGDSGGGGEQQQQQQEVAITLGPTCDNSIIWELLGIVKEAHAILELDDDDGFLNKIADLRSKLPPLRTNSYGGIAEWIEDFEEAEPGHRHYSQLFGLYPGTQISSTNESMMKAAAASLSRRLSNGGGDTGWSRAWTISLAARLLDAREVGESLTHLLVNLTYPASLLDTGPPSAFQLDGNYGAPAGISEALVQSHERVRVDDQGKVTSFFVGDDSSSSNSNSSEVLTVVRLLPALPKEWTKNGGGKVKGLRARGGFEFELSWDEEGLLTSGKMSSFQGNPVLLVFGDGRIGGDGGQQEVVIINADAGKKVRQGKLETERGQTYDLVL